MYLSTSPFRGRPDVERVEIRAEDIEDMEFHFSIDCCRFNNTLCRFDFQLNCRRR